MKVKEIELKTFEIRVINTKDQDYLKNYIYKYRHWQNILTILTINLFKSNNSDYKHFLDYAVVRACVADTKGDKKKIEIIEYIKEKYKDNQLYQDLVSVGQELKTHNLVEIVKRLKKDFSNYFKALKDYQTNPSKYTGLPQLPKAKKLSELSNYSIPLDSFNSISFKKKNVVGINLNSKMRYFYLGNTDEIDIFKNSEIKSVKVKFQNNQIYLQFTYTNNKSTNIPIINNQSTKYAGLDIGLNNIISLFIDDKTTPSLIIDGAKYKYYNYRYNKQVAKLNKTISKEVIEFKESKTGTKYPIKWSKKGDYLKKIKTYLTQKRNEYFKNSFHKLSKKVIEYLQLQNVTHLVISSSLAELKNNGNCFLKKSTKQNFIQIPFIQLLNYIEEKARDANIEVIRVDESYTSKTSCISSDVCDVQEYSNGKVQEESTCTTKPKYNGKRIKRGLFKETIINKIFNADLNGAVNHIKLAIKQSFEWLKENLWKLCNPIKVKSAGELHSLLCNIRSNNSNLKERRTTARAYRYSTIY